jgi:hypothetical protein
MSDPGHVRRPEVELGPVSGEERGMASALLLLEAVHLGVELRVRRDRPRLAQHLPALDVLALGPAQQTPDVVAGLALVEDLAEHLDPRGDGLLGRPDAHDLDLVPGVDDALLDPPGRDRAAPRDREDVLDRHQERLVERPLGLRDVVVERVGELEDRRLGLLVALERLQGRALDHRRLVARELVLLEQVADLLLDELDQVGVVDHVGLVQEHDHRGDVHLARQQHVLARLRHRPIRGGHDEDRAIHLRRPGDHVLDVVVVAGAVDVRVVALVGLVLDVRGRDRDPALLLLGSVVDLIERLLLGAAPLLRHLAPLALAVFFDVLCGLFGEPRKYSRHDTAATGSAGPPSVIRSATL